MATITLATLRDYWKKVYDSIVAHDAVDSGDPLKIGGKASDVAPTAVTAGDRANAWFDLNGRLIVKHDQALPAGTNNIGDVDVLTLPALPAGTNNIGDVDVLTLPALDVDGTAFASAARTATASSADFTNSWGRGIHIIFDVTAVATSDVKMKIEGKDPTSGKYYTILEGASVTTISTNVYKVYPALTAVANLVANDIVPKTFRITMTHANANSTTYSVGYSLV